MSPSPLAESAAFWTERPGMLDGTHWLLTVKSLDQRARRKAMVERRKSGRIGRVAHREPAMGIVVAGRLDGRAGAFAPSGRTVMREPRHAARLPDGRGWLVTTVDRLVALDRTLKARHSFAHPWFSFLHTVDLRAGRALVASSGYDQIICVKVSDSGEVERELFRWSAWEHGLNVTPSGETLEEVQAHHDHCGCGNVTVDPEEHGPLGLVTSGRAAHIAAAIWDPASSGFFFVASRQGAIYNVGHAHANNPARLVLNGLGELPHGLRAAGSGWDVTLTPKGEWWRLGLDFDRVEGWSVAGMPGKDPDAGDAEWVQQAVRYNGSRWLLIDANRGLLVMDTVQREWCRYAVNPDWCVQDAVLIR